MILDGDAWLRTGNPVPPNHHDTEACMGLTCSCMQIEMVGLDEVSEPKPAPLPLPWEGEEK